MKYVLFNFLLFFSLNAFSINVVFINPSVPGTPFWDRVTAAANASANDLGIKLTVIYGKDNRIFNYETLSTLLSKEKKPDYIIFSPYDGSTERSFSLLDESKVKFVTLERTLHKKEQKLVGFPQEKYPFWLGEIYHDNRHVGELLIDTLVDISVKKIKNKNFPLNVIGVSGSYSGESASREEGLMNSSLVNGNTKILQVTSAGWSREKARNIFFHFNERYSNIDIVWTASDGMALGVMDAIYSDLNKVSKNKVVIGGIDWTPEAIRMIKTKRLDASVGGHFMQAAWALVKIYDQHHGINVFKKGESSFTYELEVITADNVNQYMPIAEKIDWSKVDFKRFTLFNNPEDKEHDFSFQRVIDQIK